MKANRAGRVGSRKHEFVKSSGSGLVNDMKTPIHSSVLLSRFQASDLTRARKDGESAAVSSADLGLTPAAVKISRAGVSFPDGTAVSWDHLQEIASNENACFRIVDNAPLPIRGYSALTGRSFSLMPTKTAPALIVAGFPMHRVKNTDPLEAAREMIRSVAPVYGRVLDTATGLGYTAVEAAQTATAVVTIELEPVAGEIARVNPWSRELFDNPKIERLFGDSSQKIEAFADESFDRIIHDPPAVCLAGDLFSGAFYQQLFRVLRRGGRVFHYVGDPGSQSGGRTTKGVVRRLKEAGFANVISRPRAFGVTACK